MHSFNSEPLLKIGSRVRVIAPSRWISPDIADQITILGENAGLEVIVSDQCFLRHHQFAGTDAERAAEFVASFVDSSYDAIWLARGGYGAGRVTEQIDWLRLTERCRANKQKLLIGYSDATPLLEAASRFKLAIPLHGPMPIDVDIEQKRESVRQFLDGLTSAPRVMINRSALATCKVLRSGYAKGPLRGGNLTLITKMMCGNMQMRFSASVLFVEDVDEHYHSIDRNLLFLRQSGKLAELSGLVIGQFTNLLDNAIPFGLTVLDMTLHHCRDYGFPIIYGAQSGHGIPNQPLLLDQEIAFVASGDAILWNASPEVQEAGGT